MQFDAQQFADARLAQQAQSGSTSATETLLRKYYPLIRSQAAQYSAPGAELDDLVQEARVGAWYAIMLFDASKNIPLSSLVKQVARNRVFTFIKQSNRDYNKILNEAIRFDPNGMPGTIDQEICCSMIDNSSDPADLACQNLAYFELVQWMRESLSKTEFDVVMARANGLKYDEIAHQLNRDSKQVDNALSRAKKKASTRYE